MHISCGWQYLVLYKKQAEYLIEEIRSKTDKGKREKEAVFHQRLKNAIEIAGAIIAIAVSILPFL